MACGAGGDRVARGRSPAGRPVGCLPVVHAQLDDELRHRIRTALRTQLSPRHIPDVITAVPAIPRNRTGKKLELPAKKILLGAAVDDVASRDVLADPHSLDPFVALAAAWNRT
jgi:acetoacetyl-CoA synthetase